MKKGILNMRFEKFFRKKMLLLVSSFFLLLLISRAEAQMQINKEKKDLNFIVIALTNFGTQHMGIYGYGRDTTPNIDAFAKDSVVFNNFFTPASWTLPTGLSLFSSLYPYQHGVMNRYNTFQKDKQSHQAHLDSKIITLVDILKQQGYITSAFTGGFDYRPYFGLTKRFDHYQDPSFLKKSPINSFIDKKFLDIRKFGSMVDMMPKALEWVKENKDKKFFMFLQGFDAHCPYVPKPGFDKMFVDFDMKEVSLDKNYCYRGFNNNDSVIAFATIADKKGQHREYNPVTLLEKDLQFLEAQYDAEIRYVDTYLGSFLKQLEEQGVNDNTVIILLSEHGEMFGKHGRFGRAGTIRGTLYDDVVHVPLIIKHPQWEPKEIEGLSQLMDIAPTIVDLLNINKSFPFEGKSLLPLVSKGKEVHEEIYGGSVYGRKSFEFYDKVAVNEFVRNLKYKLIHEVSFLKDGTSKETYELYYIEKDQDEVFNLIDDPKRETIVKDLKGKLTKWSKQHGKFVIKSLQRDF